MGYYINQVGSNFIIKKENIQKAWDSLIELFKIEEKSIHDSSGYHYSWIDTKSVLDAKTFNEAMDEARWTVEVNPMNGDVCDIWFNGEKYGGDETIILSSIAPYVENGSYIIMQGEEGERWKWKFVDGEIEEISGRFVFDDEEWEDLDMNNKITVNKAELRNLICYVHTLLDFIDVDDFEDEENVDLVNCGYDDFVTPIMDAMNNVTFTAFSYEDDHIIAADMSTYDSKEEAIEFAKNHNWDEVVNDDTGEVVWRR